MFREQLTAWLAFLRESFTENVGLKALSLAFSIGMFAYLHGQQDQQQRTIPVDIVMRLPQSDARQLMTSVPKSIHVTVKGSARAIDALLQNRIEPVTIDLREGYQTYLTFDAGMLELPDNVKVAIIDPPSIELEWQDVITRRIPLQGSITGQPAEGYIVRGEPVLTPTEIQVRGPRGAVEVMQFARLAAFDTSGLSEGVHHRRIAVDAPPNRVNYLDPPSADVSVTIGRRTSEAKFSKRPVEVIGFQQVTITPRTVDVTVIGSPEVVRALRAEQIVPRIDLSGVLPAEGTRGHGSVVAKVVLELAQAEAEIQPPSVTVRW